MAEEVDDFLAHFGVKGMRWGKRKPESQDRINDGNHTSPKDPRKVAKAKPEKGGNVTKSEYKSLSKEDRSQYRKKTFKERSETLKEARVKNAKLTLEAATRGGSDVLIKTKFAADSVPTLMTGKEFSDHMARGGIMDINTTQVFGYSDTKRGMAVKKLVDSQMNDIWDSTAERYVKKDS